MKLEESLEIGVSNKGKWFVSLCRLIKRRIPYCKRKHFFSLKEK